MSANRPERTLHEWLDACARAGIALKQDGGEHKGPCPSCGGTDRFHVKEAEGGKILASCRHCGDFAAIVRALWPPAAPAASAAPAVLPSDSSVEGVWLYHDAEGRTAFAVIRRQLATGGKRYSQWTPTAPGVWTGAHPVWIPKGAAAPRPLYQLSEILRTEGRVVIVEGEKCADAVRTAWPSVTVTTWSGGAGRGRRQQWESTDFEPIRGRPVTLVADPDLPGRTAMSTLASRLHGMGCAVTVILPDDETAGDIADWIAEGVPEATARLREMATPYEPPDEAPPPANAPPPGRPEVDATALRDNPHFAIAGLDGSAVVVNLKRAGQYVTRVRESLLRKQALVALAPQTWWAQITGAPEMSDRVAMMCGDTMLRIADNLGQVDMSRMFGRGAVRLDSSTTIFHLGDRLLVQGEEQSLDWGRRFRVHWVSQPRLTLDTPATDAEMRQVAEAYMRYRWATATDGRRMMGWIVAALVGGALSWRVHLSIIAPSGAGKSWVLDQIKILLDDACISVTDATAPGLARICAHSSLPLIVDEAEPVTGASAGVLALLRTASGDGARVRAQQGGEGVTRQVLRFSALLSSTTAPRMAAADRTRLAPVRLGESVDDWAQVMHDIQAAGRLGNRVRARIIHDAPSIAAAVDLRAQEYQSLGMDSREALGSAALSIGWQTWGLGEHDVYMTDSARHEEAPDAETLMRDILGIRVRRGSDETDLVTYMVKSPTDAAGLYGLRFGEPGLFIAPSNPALRDSLRVWSHADIRTTLLQLPGATTTNPVSFGWFRARAVLVPYSTIEALGIDLDAIQIMAMAHT